jgi:hypothetical protein
MKILMFPHYIRIFSLELYSPRLHAHLVQREVMPQRVEWDGTLGSIPTSERVVVRASTMLTYDWDLLVEVCERYGHLVIYDDTLVHEGGVRDCDGLIGAVDEFLDHTPTAND